MLRLSSRGAPATFTLISSGRAGHEDTPESYSMVAQGPAALLLWLRGTVLELFRIQSRKHRHIMRMIEAVRTRTGHRKPDERGYKYGCSSAGRVL